jgi:hypothetical protein
MNGEKSKAHAKNRPKGNKLEIKIKINEMHNNIKPQIDIGKAKKI